jgi:hypothetical protein
LGLIMRGSSHTIFVFPILSVSSKEHAVWIVLVSPCL